MFPTISVCFAFKLGCKWASSELSDSKWVLLTFVVLWMQWSVFRVCTCTIQWHYRIASAFRGPVPIPTVSGLQYFTTLEEIQKSFEFSEDHDKTPFGPYPEIRSVGLKQLFSAGFFFFFLNRDFHL